MTTLRTVITLALTIGIFVGMVIQFVTPENAQWLFVVAMINLAYTCVRWATGRSKSEH